MEGERLVRDVLSICFMIQFPDYDISVKVCEILFSLTVYGIRSKTAPLTITLPNLCSALAPTLMESVLLFLLADDDEKHFHTLWSVARSTVALYKEKWFVHRAGGRGMRGRRFTMLNGGFIDEIYVTAASVEFPAQIPPSKTTTQIFERWSEASSIFTSSSYINIREVERHLLHFQHEYLLWIQHHSLLKIDKNEENFLL